MEEKVCPKCNNDEIKKGLIGAGSGAVVHMFPYANPRSQSSPISSFFCSNCGYVLDWYVENPERL